MSMFRVGAARWVNLSIVSEIEYRDDAYNPDAHGTAPLVTFQCVPQGGGYFRDNDAVAAGYADAKALFDAMLAALNEEHGK